MPQSTQTEIDEKAAALVDAYEILPVVGVVEFVNSESMLVDGVIYTATAETIVYDGTVDPATVEGIGSFDFISEGDSVTIEGNIITVVTHAV
jgi:hypothetical protein